MKKLLKTTSFVLALVLYLAPATEAEAAECSDTEVLTEITTTESTWCTVTPDYASFPLFKLGLCSKIPTYESYQTDCTFIVDNVAAQDLEISKGSSLSLLGDVTLPAGSYPAAVILLGNEISLKHTQTFSRDYNGWDATGGGSTVTGDRCSTRTASGSEDDIDSSMGGFFDCVPQTDVEQLTPGWFTETSGAYTSDGNVCSIRNGVIVEASSELAFDTDSSSSVICGLFDASTLETYDDYDNNSNTDETTNATRQLVVQTFNTPVVISGSSSSIDFGMKLDNMLSLEGHDDDGSGTTHINGFVDGIEFTVSVQ
jgi:hypothetical protein